MKESDEKELVLAARDGDEDAWARIVLSTRGPLVRHVFVRLRDEAASEDVVQETLLEAYRSIGTLGPPWRILAWLRRIAGRRIARHLEALARRRAEALPEEHPAAAPDDAAVGVRDEVRRRLAALPPHYREVLRLHYLEEQPVRRVAARLALPEGTVKRRMSVGRKIMAEGGGRRRGGSGHEVRAVPEIRVRPAPGRELTVPLRGPLVPYGSFLEVGDAEVFDWYHYPGGLWRERTTSEVTRRIEIAGRDCVEVRVDFLSTEEDRWAFSDGAEEFLYFVEVDAGAEAVLRVSREKRDAALEIEPRPMGDDPYHLGGMVAGTEDAGGRYDAVDLGVGDREHGLCLRRTWTEPAGGRGAAAEWYFTGDGRCVLMRRYNGPGWENWEALARSPAIEEGGIEYRLWHDCMLWG